MSVCALTDTKRRVFECIECVMLFKNSNALRFVSSSAHKDIYNLRAHIYITHTNTHSHTCRYKCKHTYRKISPAHILYPAFFFVQFLTMGSDAGIWLCVCVCVRECACVCVCVYARERERVCGCECVYIRERVRVCSRVHSACEQAVFSVRARARFCLYMLPPLYMYICNPIRISLSFWNPNISSNSTEQLLRSINFTCV